MEPQYANIIIDIVHEKLDKTFQYKVPASFAKQVQIGMEVLVPFGKGNRCLKGYIIELTDRPEYDEDKMKEILQIADSGIKIESQLIQLAAWIRNRYGSTMIQALKTVLPAKEKIRSKETKRIRLAIKEEDAREKLAFYTKRNYKGKKRLLEQLLKTPALESAYVKQQLAIAPSTIQSMLEEGVIVENTIRHYRNPLPEKQTGLQYTLTEGQQNVVDRILHDFDKGISKTYLLHGITGSGKTEVYVELIAKAAAIGRPSIVLIPEIALTYQTVARFQKRFGNRVSVMNSKLSKGEKYDQFQRAKNGELDVVIGPRSALFTPFSNLGFIIIDEEHEMSYKSESVPKYHARETAIERARFCGASVVLASATPSVEAYDKALRGEFVLLELKDRIARQGLPTVYIVDLRKELREGNRSVFSKKLKGLMQDRLNKKQQILLFLNRRGYAGFLSCRSCGKAVKCPHCDVSLSVHRNGSMVCHYCGYEQPIVKTCPTCSSKYIGGFRMGTEQVEELVQREFPTARVLRMDMDTTRKKNGHEQIVSAFSNQEADILIGTQMIVKGHDFPNVTLVGILAADMSLHGSDYKGGERTFQLLTQAAGRAGRGELAGEVVIQTYSPEHYSIVLAKDQNYKAFYEQEMQFRRLLLYPPTGRILEIFLSAAQEDEVKAVAAEIKSKLDVFINNTENDTYQVIGPAPAVIAKLNDQYRQVLYIKADGFQLLIQIRKMLEWEIEKRNILKQVLIQFDISV